MTDERKEQVFIDGIKGVLDEGLDRLPGEVRTGLTQRRRLALGVEATRGHGVGWPRLALAGLAAAAVVMTITLGWDRGSTEWQVSAELEDLEILSENGNMEMYENLDFYLWLADRDDQAL